MMMGYERLYINVDSKCMGTTDKTNKSQTIINRQYGRSPTEREQIQTNPEYTNESKLKQDKTQCQSS